MVFDFEKEQSELLYMPLYTEHQHQLAYWKGFAVGFGVAVVAFSVIGAFL